MIKFTAEHVTEKMEKLSTR